MSTTNHETEASANCCALNLHCEEKTHHVRVLLGVGSRDTCCAISQECIPDVDTGELPTSWGEKCQNSLTLPCGHVFHASMLAFHFLVNDMRCPVCRIGSIHKMCLTCLPNNMQESFKHCVSKIQSNAPSLSPNQVVSVSVDRLEMGLQLVATIQTPTSLCIIPSRMHLIDSNDPRDGTHQEDAYHIQSSFHRIFNSRLREAASDGTACVVIRICHLLFEDPISSGTFSVAQFCNMCSFNTETRAQSQNCVLYWNGMRCGILTGRGAGQCASFDVNLNRDTVRNILTSTIVTHFPDMFSYQDVGID